MNLQFNYPEGIVILLGIGLSVSASYLLPAMEYSGSLNLNWLQILGVIILFVGIGLTIRNR
ncbi:hypothetical protein AUR64_15360 [Haloprofundus marisrubri]|uniref:Transporter n=1 Tax=Haloprofundus marisrubri TaxID=1514971 RepID=A0A0W1R7S4_9EURY|nr:hypothetical protein AUR64_15360 [Haloprofundus marisrubri]